MQDSQYTTIILPKLETTSAGAKVTGDLEVTGNFVTNDTDNLSEGSTNLYYTDGRARAAISSWYSNPLH